MKMKLRYLTPLAALLAAPAFGNFLWTNADGDNDWRNPNNWTGTGTSWKVSLDGANRAIIDAGDPLSVGRNFNIGDDEAGGGNGEVEIFGSIISFERYLRIGASEGLTGTLTMTGGTINAGRSVNIGQSGSTGIFNFSGGTINTSQDRDNDSDTMVVGAANATAFLNMSGSAVINHQKDVEIGAGVNSVANLVLSDDASLLGSSNIRVGFGEDSTVTMNISGGSLNATTGFITMGQAEGANVTVNLSGGAINGDRLIFANNGTGTLNMTGGTINLIDAGGDQSTTGALVMGSSGAALNVGGDAVVNADKLRINNGGLLTLSGNALINVAGATDGNETFDFSIGLVPAPLGGWDQVDGQIEFVSLGASLVVAGEGETIGGNTVNFLNLFNAAIAEGVFITNTGFAWDTGYDAVGDFTYVSLIPEPSTYALIFGVGMLLLVLRRRLRPRS